MPYCPKCRLEYREGVERCDDCGVDLVPELPRQGRALDVEWQELPGFNTEPEARMVQGALEDAGIHTMFKRDVFVSGFGTQGHVVFVPRDRYAEAVDIRRAMVGD